MRHARVFLVEDETLIRLMLAEMIEELGHQIVAEAGSIESALPLAETAAFDIAILDVNIGVGIPTIATTYSDGSRPPVPIDCDQCVARVLTAPLDDGGDVSLLMAGQARREAVPVVNRRDPRVTRSALTAGAAARAGGSC